MPSTGDSVNKELEQSKSSAEQAVDFGKNAYDLGKKLQDKSVADTQESGGETTLSPESSSPQVNASNKGPDSLASKNQQPKGGIDEKRLSPATSEPKSDTFGPNSSGEIEKTAGEKAGETGAKKAASSSGKAAGETAGTAAGEAAGTTAGEAAGTAVGEAAGTAAGEAAGASAGASAGATAGAGAGTALLPGVGTALGMLGGYVVGKNWKKILMVAVVCVLVLFSIVLAPLFLMSAIPIAFNNATMIRREYSSDEVKQVTEQNINHTANTEQEMIQGFEIIQKLVNKEDSTFSKVEEKRQNSKYKDERGKKYEKQKERNIIIDATSSENWDIAYLAAAYQISRRMYEDPPDSFGGSFGEGATQYSENKKFMMPCAGEISSFRRFGDSGNHGNGCAVDIANEHGTPEYAPISGRVVQASDLNDGYGIYVIIEASDPTLQGWSTLCAHMSEAKVAVGQQVKQGQVIGLMGSTGDSSGDHCHFEILKDGKAQVMDSKGLFPGLAVGQVINEIKKTDEKETSTIAKSSDVIDNAFESKKSKQEQNTNKSTDTSGSDEYTKKVDRLISEMVNMCNDNSFGYQFAGRGPKDYDCSSSIIHSLKVAGFNVPNNVGDASTIILVTLVDPEWKMVENFGSQKGGNQGADPLKPGDILINAENHAALYVGNNQVAEFSSDYDGTSGDSSGDEAHVHDYYSYPWDYALRYHNGGTGASTGASGGSYETDMVYKLLAFVSNILKPVELRTTEKIVHEAEYPVYQKVSLTLKRTDGTVETKNVYELIGMEKTSVERTEKQFNELPVLGDLVEGKQVIKRTATEGVDKNPTQSHRYFVEDAEKVVSYKPTVEEKEVVKQVYLPWKKAKALQAFGLKPEDNYRGEKDSRMSNAEYAEYLRKSLIELINIKEDYTSAGPLFRWPISTNTKHTYNIWAKFDEAGNGYKGATIHSSVDVSIQKGTPVVAMADGEVKISDSNWNSYGKYVQIQHKNGYSTGYGYLSQIMVQKGAQVKSGQVLGYTGSDEKITDHKERLTFHVIKGDENGTPVDPLSFFETKDNDQFECDSKYAGEFNHKELTPKSAGSRQARAPQEYHDEIAQAMVELGMTPREDLIQKVIRQIESESGGNPQAVQGISDINSGNPITIGDGKCHWCPNDAGRHCGDTNIAHGLLQTIITTFEAYKAPGHEDIFNSYDNILASLKYMRNNYGENFDGIGEGHGY